MNKRIRSKLKKAVFPVSVPGILGSAAAVRTQYPSSQRTLFKDSILALPALSSKREPSLFHIMNICPLLLGTVGVGGVHCVGVGRTGVFCIGV